MITYDDSPAMIARRRAILLGATEANARRGIDNRATWTPCAGVGQPLAESWYTNDPRGRRMAVGFCGTCGDLVGGRWTNGTKSGPLPDGMVLARRHKDKRDQ